MATPKEIGRAIEELKRAMSDRGDVILATPPGHPRRDAAEKRVDEAATQVGVLSR